jgi:hypothetical protein
MTLGISQTGHRQLTWVTGEYIEPLVRETTYAHSRNAAKRDGGTGGPTLSGQSTIGRAPLKSRTNFITASPNGFIRSENPGLRLAAERPTGSGAKLCFAPIWNSTPKSSVAVWTFEDPLGPQPERRRGRSSKRIWGRLEKRGSATRTRRPVDENCRSAPNDYNIPSNTFADHIGVQFEGVSRNARLWPPFVP